MNYLDLTILGIVIASNNFSFSLGLGALGVNKYHWRIVLVFTVVEFIVPLLGLILGRFISSLIGDYASTFGSLILTLLGLYTLISAFKAKDVSEKVKMKIVSVKGITLVALGLSLDNLIVGFGLGLGEVHPLALSLMIAAFSFLFTLIGLKIGKYLKKHWSNYVEVFAGILLILLGIMNYFEWF